MALTATNSTKEPRSFSIGPVKIQLMDYVATTAATTGTITADNLKEVSHILLLGGQIKHSAAPTFATNVATIACITPAETAATLTLGGVTYTATADRGASGNSITVAYTAGGTAGAEVVTVTGTAISVSIEDGVSTITQVRTAVNASAAAAALVTATGTSSTPVDAAVATALTGGVTGGARGTAVCIGK